MFCAQSGPMRTARIKVRPEEGEAVYHVMANPTGSGREMLIPPLRRLRRVKILADSAARLAPA
jgi:hypothetical protein